ncbi:MAG: hypothetical protein AB1422_06100 [bacterium]
MKIIADKRLFWFLKEGTNFDLSQPSVLDMYVQQIITRGRTEDIKELLKLLNLKELQTVLERIKHFITDEVRRFWEDFIKDDK